MKSIEFDSIWIAHGYDREKALKEEITNEMRNKKTFMEIENLENKIRNEIYEKYNPKFDENDLSNEDTKKLKYEWHSATEMLSFERFGLSETALTR